MAFETTSFLRPPVEPGPLVAPRWWSALLVASALVALCAGFGALPAGGLRTAVTQSLVAVVALAVAALMARCWLAVRSGRRGTALAVLAAAFAGHALTAVLRAAGFTDAAAWGGMLAYPCLLAGVVLLPMGELTAQDLRRLALDAAIVLLGGAIVLGSLFGNGGSGGESLLAGAMPLADLASLAALLWLVTGRRPGGVRGFAGWLAWSVAFQVLTDVAVGWQALAGDPVDDRLFALGRVLSLACAGLAAVRLLLAPGEAVDGGSPRRVADSLAVCHGVLAVAVLVRLPLSVGPGAAYFSAIAALLALVLVRQALALRDYHRLNRDLELLTAGMEERIRERTEDLRRQVAERAGMERAERGHRLMAEALSDTAAALASTLDLGEVLDRVLANVGRAAPHSAATVMFIEDGVARVVHHSGYAERGLREWIEGLAVPLESWPRLHEMAVSGRAAIQEDTAAGDPGWAFYPQVAWVRCWLGAPLRAKNRVFGFINLVSDRHGAFNDGHRERLMAFADQMGLALENARLFAQTRKRVERLSLLTEVSTRLNRVEGLGAALDDVIARMPPTLAAARVTLAVLDADQRCFRVVADHGRLASPSYAGSSMERAPFAEAGLLDGPDLVLVRDPAADVRFADPRFDLLRQSLVRDQVGTLLLNPLRLHGHLHGLLVVQSDDRAHAFSASDGELVRTAGNLLAARIEIDRVLGAERTARTAAEEASRLKSEFLANTSHELRTPLTGILLSLELAADGGIDEDQRRDLLDTAQQSGQRLLGTINGLLDLAKIEAGRLDVQAERLDPVHAAAAVIDALRGTALRIGVGLELAGWTSGVPCHAWADPTLVHQILTNLVGNALKFTERGGVVVSLAAVPDRVRIRIADTGVGISPEQIARLFQPFVQADGSSTRRFEGTGLGLVIARRMAERMGGSLTLSSAGTGTGTVAEVELPAG